MPVTARARSSTPASPSSVSCPPACPAPSASSPTSSAMPDNPDSDDSEVPEEPPPFLSLPGQAYDDGMRFLQFYFGLPIAMVLLSIVVVPIYYRLKVYTAYEYLERRFDLKTRQLTAFLFLVQRGLAAGITLYAPAI